MMIKFASRMDQLTGSAIRELLALASKPEIISFAGGLPAPELFPVEEMAKASAAVMEEMGQTALQYSSTDGFAHFRQIIVDRMKAKNNIDTTIDNIIVTSGSQQGLDFSGRIFLDKDDIVLLESPSYLGAINAFKANEPKFIEVPTDEGGMIMEELEKILEENDRVKMIYVIPDFQNPSSRTWSLERRQKFMEIINKFEIPVIEDNPYGELRFEGEAMPSLKSMDTKGLVVFLGTFSKILAPGYRLGWICADGEIYNKYNFMAQAASLQATTIGQLETAKFIEMYDLDAHVQKIIEVYGKRRDLMYNTMLEEFPAEVKFAKPTGGLFMWVELPEHMDAAELAKECLKENVAYVPGEGFYPDGQTKNTFRMNYSMMPEDKIVEGIKRIAKVLKANI
ncbi:MAG: PLP-dependent aminotransferase family protein [Eubacterium sp.]|nr:PLP-dependent aminotransferase family protein [Eubacterium sp.]